MSNEYSCRYCGKECKNDNSLRNHERLCKNNPNRQDIKSWSQTDKWKESMASRQYIKQNHYFACECQYCGRSFTTKNSKTFHEKYCKENPNAIKCKGHKISQELKEQISLKQKENYANGKSRWHISRNEDPYSEKYFINWLDTLGIKYKHNYWTNRYYLDFAFTDTMCYFEVNGEQHYQGNYPNRDKERYDILEKEGWKCLSLIRWSEYQKLSKEEKESFLSDLEQAIRTSTILDFEYKNNKESKKNRTWAEYVESEKLPQAEQERRVKILLDSKIDFSKYGCIAKAIRETELSKRQIYNTLKYMGLR